MISYKNAFMLFFMIIFTLSEVKSQELEPRALTNLPLGTNFFVAGYAHSRGNILMDSSLPVEDYYGKIHSTAFAYARSINFFGKSGKIDVVLPVATGNWTGNYLGKYYDVNSLGIGDVRVRATINFTGAPALGKSEYKNYKQKTVSGLSVQLIIPTGHYNSDQLPNLGGNRWALRSTYGISHTFNKWIFEAYAGVWLFTDNHEYLKEHNFSQPPFWVVKLHLTRIIKRGMWLAVDSGYGYGSEARVDKEKNEVVLSGMKVGLTFALPLNKFHTLKFAAVGGFRFQQGGDFDRFAVVYQYRWND
ncbi:MAG: transporter [Flavobacteriales bacterium]|nr:transporter [Flavobacteriales bacterium]